MPMQSGARQEVHCELAWSADFRHWHRIDEGRDLIPLGAEGSFESHICYGSVPLITADGTISEYYFGVRAELALLVFVFSLFVLVFCSRASRSSATLSLSWGADCSTCNVYPWLIG